MTTRLVNFGKSMLGWGSSSSSTDKRSHHTIDGGPSKEELLGNPKKEGGHGSEEDHLLPAESLKAQVAESRVERGESDRTRNSSNRRNTQESVGPGSHSRRRDVQNESEVERNSGGHRRKEREKEREQQFQDLTKEVETLRGRLQATHQDLVNANGANFKAQKELADANNKIKEHDRRIKALQNERNTMSIKLNAQTAQQTEKTKAAERKAAELEERSKKQEAELQMLREKIRATEDRQARMASLLDERTSDLKGVQPFLTTADRYSGAEVIKIVEGLNAEIFQAAAFMAELVVDDSMVANKEEHELNMEKYKGNLGLIRNELGNELFAYLSSKSAEVRSDPLPLQLGIQHLLVVWCAHRVEEFATGSFDKELKDLYQRIRTSEMQAIAGRWRAITSSHLEDAAQGPDTNIIFSKVAVLLFLCGWSWKSEESQRSARKMRQKVSAMDEQCKRLKAAVKEGITTADMEVFYVNPGGEFGKGMVNSYADAIYAAEGVAPSKTEIVLCTVGLGLRKSLAKRDNGGHLTYQVDVLLEPKVALVSVLSEASEDVIMAETLPEEHQGVSEGRDAS